jgi:hypothetical protein
LSTEIYARVYLVHTHNAGLKGADNFYDMHV